MPICSLVASSCYLCRAWAGVLMSFEHARYRSVRRELFSCHASNVNKIMTSYDYVSTVLWHWGSECALVMLFWKSAGRGQAPSMSSRRKARMRRYWCWVKLLMMTSFCDAWAIMLVSAEYFCSWEMWCRSRPKSIVIVVEDRSPPQSKTKCLNISPRVRIKYQMSRFILYTHRRLRQYCECLLAHFAAVDNNNEKLQCITSALSDAVIAMNDGNRRAMPRPHGEAIYWNDGDDAARMLMRRPIEAPMSAYHARPVASR